MERNMNDDSLFDPEMQKMLLSDQVKIGQDDINKAIEILERYKQGKANLENRIVEDERWYEIQHWDAVRPDAEMSPKSSSAWLFNTILNKHADAMDNFPEPIILPREKSDERSAKDLTQIIPVVMEYNDFRDTYNLQWWEKLKHGTCVYGVFWNNEKENGLGDIDIKGIDLLKIFWEPGITNIQDSRNLFIVDLVDKDIVEGQYPMAKESSMSNVIDITKYVYDDTIDTSEKVVVVDWYYKVRNASGKTVLHYVKFVGNTLLYASENDATYSQEGWYSHGMYPVVFDVLFPEKSTPVGFGYVAVCKDPQIYIDSISSNILETSNMATKRRWFASESTNVNEEELLDWSKPVVHVAGEISESRIRDFTVPDVSPVYLNILQMKIEEMKDTSANRDVNSGGTGGGVTAASAIAALQEAGNKTSRDMISASYKSYEKITELCLELMRQFYDETRSFRILGDTLSDYQFSDFSNEMITDQLIGYDSNGVEMYRRPVFDYKVKAQKKNPFSRMEENERAKELYGIGFFNPDRAQEALGALEMMDFEGIDKVKDYVKSGNTLYQMVQQLSQQVAMLTGQMMPMGEGGASMSAPAPGLAEGSDGMTGDIMESRVPKSSYAQNLVQRSRVNV